MPIYPNDVSSDDDPARIKKILCLFLDGLGVASVNEVNAVANAKTINLNKYVRNFPVTLLSGATKNENRRYWSLGTGISDDSDIFPQAKTCISEILSQNNLKQLKICASEQTLAFNLFFNNYKESAYSNEERICLNTPNPEASLLDFGKDIVKVIRDSYKSNRFDVIFASLPLAHEASTRGGFKEAVKIIEQLDKLLPKIIDPIIANDDIVIICSPYGNAERTRDLAADWEDKEATMNPVPFLLIGSEYEGKTIGLADPLEGDLSVLAPGGSLADFSPTLLTLLNIKIDKNIVSKSLI